jgi:hypothetical protein
MAFDRSKEAKLASIARRAARKGKDAARFAAIARDEAPPPRKAEDKRRDWR